MKKWYFSVTLLFFFSLSSEMSFSQAQDFTSKLTQTSKGELLTFGNSTQLFSLNINGKKFDKYKKTKEQNWLAVDGKVLQYVFVPFPQKMDYSKLSEKKKQDFLSGYEGYEMDYIKKNLNVKNLDEHIKYETLNGRLFLFWVYDMPKKVTQDENIKQQCYLITVCADHMLVLNSPVEKDLTGIFDFLNEIGSSLKIISP